MRNVRFKEIAKEPIMTMWSHLEHAHEIHAVALIEDTPDLRTILHVAIAALFQEHEAQRGRRHLVDLARNVWIFGDQILDGLYKFVW